MPNHNNKTLEKIIVAYVQLGTKIISDCWKAYNTRRLQNLECIHETINHLMDFKDSISGAHTNTIEGIWSVVKRFMQRYGTMKTHYNG